MRFAVLAIAIFALATPALGQESEMDRAESEIRDSMASTGVEVQRTAPDELRLRMPSDITFDFNRAEVKYEFLPRIFDLARTLSRYPGMAVEVIGHADAIGPDDYNQTLSERRARSVGAVLMGNGVSHYRIGVRGMGEWEPIASNATEWGRARNRRVEIRIKTSK